MHRTNRFSPASALALGALVFAGCAVKLDPFGRPYSPDTAMPTGPIGPCYADQLDSPPILQSGTKPLYPIGENLKNRMARITMEIIVYADGKVALAKEPTSANTWFLRHAATATRDWVVAPAIKSGQPVTVTCRVVFVYELH